MLAALQSQLNPGLRSQIPDLQSQISDPESQIPDLSALAAAIQSQATTFTIHPGVAETVRSAADPAVLAAADIELGNYHIAVLPARPEDRDAGRRRHGGRQCPPRRPYLLRQSRWEEASTLLERMLQRDRSPATLAFALPLLRRIAEATAGTERGADRRRRPGQCVAEGRPHGRGGADAAGRDRPLCRPRQFPGCLRRRRPVAQPAHGRRPLDRGADRGGREGRLHASGGAGAVDATGGRVPTSASAERHGPLRRGVGRGRKAPPANGLAARKERGRRDGQPLERPRSPAGHRPHRLP